MNKDKLNKVLADVLKIIKLLAAIIMLILGFLGEGEKKMAEVDDSTEVVFRPDSVVDALIGLLVAACTGWPSLYLVGASCNHLFS